MNMIISFRLSSEISSFSKYSLRGVPTTPQMDISPDAGRFFQTPNPGLSGSGEKNTFPIFWDKPNEASQATM